MKKIYMLGILLTAFISLESAYSSLLVTNVNWGNCSKSHAQMKYQHDQMKHQKHTMKCQQGKQKACAKAQEDLQKMQKHQMEMQQCPNP